MGLSYNVIFIPKTAPSRKRQTQRRLRTGPSASALGQELPLGASPPHRSAGPREAALHGTEPPLEGLPRSDPSCPATEHRSVAQ